MKGVSSVTSNYKSVESAETTSQGLVSSSVLVSKESRPMVLNLFRAMAHFHYNVTVISIIYDGDEVDLQKKGVTAAPVTRMASTLH